MQHALLNLLGTSLIPELSSDISAGTTRNAHLILIPIAAIRAFPDQLAASLFFHDLNLSVITTALTVIALGVQLRVHDIIIDVFHDRQYRLDIVLHIRNLNITDCSTR